jgi:hypothetical protein
LEKIFNVLVNLNLAGTENEEEERIEGRDRESVESGQQKPIKEGRNML